MEFAASKDGTRIAYSRSGLGRPLVLVHGSTWDHTRWAPLVPFLESHVTVCAMDRRGRGRSGDTQPYALGREVEDVAALAEALARQTGGPVDVFGHSFGAVCALEATRAGAPVRRLVLYEPVVLASAGPSDFAERADALMAEGRRDEVVELFFREILGASNEEVAAFRAQPSWAVRVAAAHTLAREDRAEGAFRFDPGAYKDWRTPTLLLRGSESPAFLQESTDALASALPGARVAVLEGQQHFAMATAPDLVADVVLTFLGSKG